MFEIMCDCPDKDIKLKIGQVFWKKISDCPGVYIPDADINDDEDMELPFICFHRYESFSSCYLNQNFLPDNSKTYTSCTNIENEEKGKVIIKKNLVLKSCRILDFHSDYYISEIINEFSSTIYLRSWQKSLCR